MHIPDGFIDPGTSAAAGVVAVGAIGMCVKQAGKAIDDREVPLAGLAAAFVFSVQMLNFPVASGTSGHLLGGALAAVLVGPWLGPLCVAVVLLVQALLFADGGLSALGLNILNMAVIGAWGGYLVFVVLRSVLPRARSSIVAASGIAAGVVGAVGSVGVHVAVRDRRQRCGVAVDRRRGDGRHPRADRDRRRTDHSDDGQCRHGGAPRSRVRGAWLHLRPDRHRDPGDDSSRGLIVVRRNIIGLVVVGLVVAVALATFASPFASSSPDGLEKVAADKALDTDVEAHALAGGPLADYGVEGVDNARVSTGLAGLIGVAVTFAVGFGVFAVIKRARVEPDPRPEPTSAAAGP